MQLQPVARLFAAVAQLSVVDLVGLRERSRQQPDAPAETVGLSASDLRMMRITRTRTLVTARDVFYALAGLGGHLGRMVKALNQADEPASTL